MPDTIYKIDYINFTNRVIKKLWPILFGIVVVTLILLSKPKFHWITFIIYIIGFVVWAIFLIFSTKRFVSEIEFNHQTISISGYDFNTIWRETYNLEDVNIKIRSVARGKGRYEYVLRFSTPKTNYIINDLFNWNYFELIKIFTEFKNSKNEKIILDEKFMIDNMEKKAHGLSDLDILLNKEIEKD